MGIRKHIPNTVTSMNLICGVVGVIVALNGNLQTAFILMLAAAVFDFLDGFAARLLKAYSETGKELDSLADDVSFGVLPSVMLYCVYGTDIPALRFFPLVIAAFSALRLAKFNLDERQHSSFLGLPTPACAMVCGSLAVMASARPDSLLSGLCDGDLFIPLLSVALSALLVCEIPMFAMKVATGDKASKAENVSRIIFFCIAVLSVAVTVAWSLNWCFIPFVTFVSYIVINILRTILCHSRAAGAVSAVILLVCLGSCSRKVETPDDELPMVKELIAESLPALHDLAESAGKTSGTIAVIGDPSSCLRVARELTSSDLFDNIDARLVSDALPDFAGETVVAICDTLSSGTGGDTLRETAVRIALCAVDSTVACKMIVFCGTGFPEYGSADVENLFSRIGCDVPVIASSDTSFSFAGACFKTLRDRNAFTHDVSYPILKVYMTESDGQGEIRLSDLKSFSLENLVSGGEAAGIEDAACSEDQAASTSSNIETE